MFQPRGHNLCFTLISEINSLLEEYDEVAYLSVVHNYDATSIRRRRDFDSTTTHIRRKCSRDTIRLRFDCDTIRQRYDHRATSMRFPFDVHSSAFTYLSLSSGRGKLYYTILYAICYMLYTILYTIYYILYTIYYILYYTIQYFDLETWKHR